MSLRLMALLLAALVLSGCFAATGRRLRDERTATLDAGQPKWYHYKFDEAVSFRYSFTTSGLLSTYLLDSGRTEAFAAGEPVAGVAFAKAEHADEGEASASLQPGAYVVALRCDGPAACNFRLLAQAAPAE